MGMAGRTGRIAAGCAADLVVLDLRDAARMPLVENLASVVHYGGPDCVRATMVGGAWVYRDGKVLSFDEDKARDRFAAVRAEILEAAKPELTTADEAAPYFAGLAGRAATKG